MGFSLGELINDLAGGMREGRTLKACIPGGSSVPILNKEETENCVLDYEGCIEQGTMLEFRQGPFMSDEESLIAMADEATSWQWRLCNLRGVIEAKHDMRSVRPL